MCNTRAAVSALPAGNVQLPGKLSNTIGLGLSNTINVSPGNLPSQLPLFAASKQAARRQVYDNVLESAALDNSRPNKALQSGCKPLNGNSVIRISLDQPHVISFRLFQISACSTYAQF